ncbi:hypothetical protein BTA49_14010 [Pseudomonas mosselii]|nr:hypothetical protein BTA49_14010 [Pseudomonas mosselii]
MPTVSPCPRLFGWLKENRRLGTRRCKLAESFAAMIRMACWRRCSWHYFSYSAQANAKRFATRQGRWA